MTQKNLKALKLFLLGFFFLMSPTFLYAESLREQLQAKANAGKADPKTKTIMSGAIEDLRKSKISDRAKKVGDNFPEFKLKNSHGVEISLKSLLAKGRLVVTFYRGSWCPYCNIQLMEYQKHISQWKNLGATVVAISPELPELAKVLAEKRGLTYDLLFDENNKFAEKVGLVFGLKDDLRAVYEKFGIDLSKSQGNSAWRLPVSATYVVGKDRKIKYAFVDVDYKNRAEPSEIEAALK